MKNILAQNHARTLACNGVIKPGLIESQWRLECSNGMVISLPRAQFGWLKLGDMPTIILGFVVTALVDAGDVPGTETN